MLTPLRLRRARRTRETEDAGGEVSADHGAVAELAERVGTPGPQASISLECEGHVAPPDHLYHARQTIYLDRDASVRCAPVPELAGIAAAPCLHGSVTEQCVARARPRGDGDHVAQTPHFDRGALVKAPNTVAELSELVVTPRPYAPVAA